MRNSVDLADICRTDPCDRTYALGSYWPNSRLSFESRLVKCFKRCSPVTEYEPHISSLCRFYAKMIVEKMGGEHIDFVVRVLGSHETEAEPTRPQSMLVDMICAMTGARNASGMFFKSETRPPMRSVERLAGPEALKARVQYVVQDLFVRPGMIDGSVLLIDDIGNTGASMRTYGWGLKTAAGVDRIFTVNLAMTRFGGGKDGRGMLLLNTSGLTEHSSLLPVYIGEDGVLHARRDCPSLVKALACEPRFMAERTAIPCASCAAAPNRQRKWWRIW